MTLFFSRKRETARTVTRLAKTLGATRKEGPTPRPESSRGRFGAWASKVDWQRIRINSVIGFFCVVWVLLWLRAWQLQMVEGPKLADKARRQHVASELVSGKRGMIFDRQGRALARSVEARSVYANPRAVDDPAKTADALASILGVNRDKIFAELSDSKKRFVWIKRKIDDNAALEVTRANLAGVGLSREYDRFYPFKHMAGQLLGFVGMDDKGLEGLERSLDDRLGAMPVRQIVQRDAMGRKFYLNEEGGGEPVGEDVTLTLDMEIQYIAEEALARVVKEFDAKWAGSLVVDIKSGDILAWAQYPFFDPNTYRDYAPAIYRNRVAQDALEPGSTFKPFVMAAALREKKVTPGTLIDCEGGKWTRHNFTIRDTSTRGVLPAEKVLRYSSNIGMAKIGLTMGASAMRRNLSALGFGEPVDVPVANSRGILRQPRDWGEMDIMAASFGQSVSVTCLQMAQAYLTLLNHGVYKPLRLVMEDNPVEEAPRRVFSEKTVREVVAMMRDVVEARDGTGKRAKIEGVETGGKTGTAQKADRRSKTYGSGRLASFVGFFPVDDPRYLILVFVDEPTRNQFGGVVAAPAFREIGSRTLSVTGFPRDGAPTPKKAEQVKRKRGLKMASAPDKPWSERSASVAEAKKEAGMNFPGHLAKPAARVPDVMGKSLRNAVELFARAGVVPELKGVGNRVVKQDPPAGSPWPATGQNANFILWLSER